jgi:putative nucleotidyltransferase with HDIG domain
VDRILFVDDEPGQLTALEKAFEARQERWTMKFARGAEAALALLASETFDAVVTDLSMPGMDGSALLRHVQQSHPHTARILLSTSADVCLAAEASAIAHRTFMKGRTPESLGAIIDRVLRMRELLDNEPLRDLISSLGTLPAVPRMYQALTAAVEDPKSDAKKISAIIGQDVGMTSRVLKFVNSAYFGFTQSITMTEPAVVRLGVNAVRHLALTFEVFSPTPEINTTALEQLEHHALLTARIARKLVKGQAAADMAFAAGLLHDVGQLVLMSGGGKRFREVLEKARERKVPLHNAEAELLGATHAQVGAYLLQLWGLPQEIVEPVALHHEKSPGRAGADIPSAVALANALAHEINADHVMDEPVDLTGVDNIVQLRAIAKAEAAGMA